MKNKLYNETSDGESSVPKGVPGEDLVTKED